MAEFRQFIKGIQTQGNNRKAFEIFSEWFFGKWSLLEHSGGNCLVMGQLARQAGFPGGCGMSGGLRHLYLMINSRHFYFPQSKATAFSVWKLSQVCFMAFKDSRGISGHVLSLMLLRPVQFVTIVFETSFQAAHTLLSTTRRFYSITNFLTPLSLL